MSESVNRRTDGCWHESHPISSPRAFGSGELKMPTLHEIFGKKFNIQNDNSE